MHSPSLGSLAVPIRFVRYHNIQMFLDSSADILSMCRLNINGWQVKKCNNQSWVWSIFNTDRVLYFFFPSSCLFSECMKKQKIMYSKSVSSRRKRQGTSYFFFVYITFVFWKKNQTLAHQSCLFFSRKLTMLKLSSYLSNWPFIDPFSFLFETSSVQEQFLWLMFLSNNIFLLLLSSGENFLPHLIGRIPSFVEGNLLRMWEFSCCSFYAEYQTLSHGHFALSFSPQVSWLVNS